MKAIKRIREEKGLEQSELAKLMNVSQSTISQWENDICNPTNKKIKELAQILNCSFNDLFL